MRLTIDLPPELEAELARAAAREGMDPGQYARELLERGVREADQDREALGAFEQTLPRRSPADVLEMARKQGVQPIRRIEDLRGGFWPQDESVDEFVETIRRWRRGEA